MQLSVKGIICWLQMEQMKKSTKENVMNLMYVFKCVCVGGGVLLRACVLWELGLQEHGYI